MKTQPFTVYILLTSANTFYIGQTKNLKKRLEEHKKRGPKSAKYMKYFSSFKLVYKEVFSSRSEAMKREAILKRLSRPEKETLVLAFTPSDSSNVV
ncbi:hypothetical protein A2886_02805 [candidate division WWE3 bacterium RIFCSPHIGHO2_01_FULL_42_13]|uniref:GIY-YIG domain-containing protein n=1 Tax=candidate division WWE3 bacterium RIFCSPHIGHO2_01_FULL_42_13 TaxID=1802617 RepID=A0A1F4US03_UNCKA|nr:MAG: hypothetical protein A2886_02805 [candidate division WWE3 bacterium RIFCSPHIGHO2_01_FULL_42_13]